MLSSAKYMIKFVNHSTVYIQACNKATLKCSPLCDVLQLEPICIPLEPSKGQDWKLDLQKVVLMKRWSEKAYPTI